MAAVEAGIHDWINGQTGLPMRWSNQNAPQPDYAYINALLFSGLQEGQSERVYSDFDDGAPAGEELTETVRAGQALVFNIECHQTQVTNANQTAFAILTGLVASLGKSSVRDSLRSAGLALINEGTVQDISAIVNAGFDSRATLDVTFRACSVTTSKVAVIEQTEVEGCVDSRRDGGQFTPSYTID
jgi:hypothetical protein